MDPQSEELLRRLAMNDEVALEAALGLDVLAPGDSALDSKSLALVRLASLVALQSAPQSYEWGVSAALAAGASNDEVVGVLTAVAPIVGVTRINRAAADVATALGIELELPGRE